MAFDGIVTKAVVKELKEKLDFAIMTLEMVVDKGYDFSVSIPKEVASELFDDEGDFKEIVTMVSSEKFKNKIISSRASVHLITNEE